MMSEKNVEKSLFAQHFASLKNKSDTLETTANDAMRTDKDIVNSNIISAMQKRLENVRDSDKESIHQENIQKLKEMSEEEILEEQKKLLQSLGLSLT